VTPVIPVVLFAYARARHLERVLACLRENRPPLLWAFADGAKGAADAAAVSETRAQLRAVDWCEVRLVERENNLGLGRNVLSGVTEIAARHEAFIVWEDDLVCVPGTYDWLSAALRHYATDERVMSVAGWTHPELSPGSEEPYCDARAEGWVWGTYARAWVGMHETAAEKLRVCRRRGVDPIRYGADLWLMLRNEARRNLWAVRWVLHHFQHDGLCVRPPTSLVEHIGTDGQATNAAADSAWRNPALRSLPVPAKWPPAVLYPALAPQWRRAVWRRLAWRQRVVAWLGRWLPSP
jgi:hypothetical protein